MHCLDSVKYGVSGLDIMMVLEPKSAKLDAADDRRIWVIAELKFAESEADVLFGGIFSMWNHGVFKENHRFIHKNFIFCWFCLFFRWCVFMCLGVAAECDWESAIKVCCSGFCRSLMLHLLGCCFDMTFPWIRSWCCVILGCLAVGLRFAFIYSLMYFIGLVSCQSFVIFPFWALCGFIVGCECSKLVGMLVFRCIAIFLGSL